MIMKNRKMSIKSSLSRVLSLIVLAALFFSFQEKDAYALEIEFLLGEVKVVRNGKKTSVTQSTELKDGDILETAEQSTVVLVNKQGTRIELQEKSKLLIDKKIIESGSMSLIRGTLMAKFKKIKKGRPRKLYTPTNVCAVRGTEFTVAVSNSGKSRVQMKTGKLDIYNPSGKVTVRRKQAATSTPGEAPGRSFEKKSSKKWKEDQDEQLDKNPQTAGKKMDQHIKVLAKSSNDDEKNIQKLNNNLAALNSPSSFKRSEKKLNATEDKMSDNYLLNKSSNAAIDHLLNDYKDNKQDIYNMYQKIKEESNKVLEQQKRNLEEINKVREAYKKAYKEIMEEHRKRIEEIKNKTKIKK